MLFPYPESYKLALPPLTTTLMVIATLITVPFNVGEIIYYPIIALFALVVLEHLYLIWDNGGISRLEQVFYALIHCPLAFVIWTFCLMHINGDMFTPPAAG
ncbi:hypothetical protein NFHSH190041_07530 [Shewanella sp. NFH-SH190041]|nr:hypothetical protein NFHSH190041_07530 [Shewanella sp. NFH-SH190041]